MAAPAEAEAVATTPASKSQGGAAVQAAMQVREEIVQWLWQSDDTSLFSHFGAPDSKLLEAAYLGDPLQTLTCQMRGQWYSFDFKTMTQTNTDTKSSRRIQREAPADTVDAHIQEEAEMVERLTGVSLERVRVCPEKELDQLFLSMTDAFGQKLRQHAHRLRPGNFRPGRDAQESRCAEEKGDAAVAKVPTQAAKTPTKEVKRQKSDWLKLGLPLFEGKAEEVSIEDAVRLALSTAGERWVCLTCEGNVVPEEKRATHADFHKKNGWVEPKYALMSWQWYLESAQKKSSKWAIVMYTMEGPLCYLVNTSMRNYKFHGDDTEYRHTKAYAFVLRQELLSYPPVAKDGEFAKLFRAVGYEAHKTYKAGSVQRMPQPTSTSTDVLAMKGFFNDKKVGCVLLFNSRTARAIKDYSMFPAEDEILVLPDTAFRIKVADPVMIAFVNSALKLPFEVGVVQLDEMTEKEVLQAENEVMWALRKRFFEAATHGELNKMKKAIAEGALVDWQNGNKTTALHHAALGYEREKNVEAARFLIDNGAVVDARTKDGETPLFWAAQKNCHQVAQLLCERGAKANAKCNTGRTPMYYAKKEGVYGQQVLAVLKKFGPPPPAAPAAAPAAKMPDSAAPPPSPAPPPKAVDPAASKA